MKKISKKHAPYIIVALIISLAFIAAVVFLKGESQTIATINGEGVTLDELNARKAIHDITLTSTEKQDPMSKFVFLNDVLVPDKLLHQQAKRLGVTVANRETEKGVEKFIEAYGDPHVSEEQLFSFVKQSMYKEKLLKRIIPGVEVTEEEISAFYDENKDSLNQENQEGDAQTLEDVHDEIKNMLKGVKHEFLVREYVTRLAHNGNVEMVDPTLWEE